MNRKWVLWVGILTLSSVGLFFLLQTKSNNFVSQFDSKKAFQAILDQVQFGPRVPGSEGHRKVIQYLKESLQKNQWTVTEQSGEIEHPLWKKKVTIKNIIATLHPEAKKRILLTAHYDTRPFGENDLYIKDKPILGANDGASGVGILLELSRVLSLQSKFKLGIDIIFWDFEDTGMPEIPESYCLGSRYWSENPHLPDYKAEFGINLDMVGGFNATFPREGFSVESANSVYDLLLNASKELKFEKYFPERSFGHMVDDHVNVIRYRKIPMVDLIHMDEQNQFFSAWHTMQDDMSQISEETIKVVGMTLETLLYKIQDDI